MSERIGLFPEKGVDVKIRGGVPGEPHQLMVNGVDITRSCRALTLEMGTQEVSRIRLDLFVRSVDAETASVTELGQ